VINNLLQKDLLSQATHKSTLGIDLSCSDNNGVSEVNGEWTLVTTKNHVSKSGKCNKSESVNTGQLMKTSNCYPPLIKIFADNEGTIPVIVNP
jgi:hypothetical protein